MTIEEESPIIGRRKLKIPGEVLVSNQVNEVVIKPEPILSTEYTGPSKQQADNSVISPISSVFSRYPRDFIPFPKTKIDIQSPGQSSDAPNTSLVTMLLPLGGALIGIVISAIAAVTNPIFLFASLPMIIFSVVGGVINYKRERSDFQSKSTKRNTLYHDYITKQHQSLDLLVEEQRRASLIPNPDLFECMRRVEIRDQRLWERKPSDSDYLEIRMGTGRLPRTFEITPPSMPQVTQEPDNLYKEAIALVDSYGLIDGLAVNLPLKSAITAGLIGSRQDQIETIRAMLMQLACHHSPNEVKLVLIIPEGEVTEWAWARWLPHTWSDDRQIRFFAANDAAVYRILAFIEQELKQRKNQQGQTQTSVTLTPSYVLIFAEKKVWKGDQAVTYAPLLELLLKEGSSLGAYSIFLGDQQIPKDSGAIISLDGNQALVKLIIPTPSSISFKRDEVEVNLAERFARSLAALHLEKGGENASNLPSKISMFEMLKVNKVEDLFILDRWVNNQLEKSLSVPLGIRSGGKPLLLDLHERAHGPHGLLAGTSGSGKSELLQTLIASLSIQYSPEKVAFILVDFKALMVPPFENLPHQVGIITNLEGNLAVRALIGLEAEKERRQRLFLQVGKSNIDEYQELFFQGQTPEPLPHLIIIVDEFAELAVDQPDFIQGLVSLSRVGRSLGIHLLLGTQKPAGVVSESIWANSRTRLCLRVERPEDSQEVLKRPDAAAITAIQVGRAYLQVGMNEIFEQFQGAWATAPYETESNLQKTTIASLIDLDGSLHPLRNEQISKIEKTAYPTQLSAVVDQIIKTRQKQIGVQPLKRPWLPPLEKIVLLKDHRSTSEGWDGQKWQKVDRWLNPIVGVYDNPAGQSRGNLSIPIGKEGNLAIYGAPGSGKTTLLQTIITSLVLDHSPQDLQIYIMDFGGRSFKAFEPLPHIGAIVLPDETERFQRLLQFIKNELDRRKKLLEPFGGIIDDYRIQNSGTLADIVLILDNYTAFANSFNEQIGDLSRLASEGGNFGMHLVITTNVVSSIPISLGSNISLSIALELVDPTEYISVIGRTNGITPTRGVAGRGLIKGTPPLEFQTALAAENLSELKTLFQPMLGFQSIGKTRLIPPKVDVIPLSALLTHVNEWAKTLTGPYYVPIGVDLSSAELNPFLIDLDEGPHFWIAGPVSSGKSYLLQTWLLALAEQYSPHSLKMYLVDLGCTSTFSNLSNIPHSQQYLVNGEQFESSLVEINAHFEQISQELKLNKKVNISGNSSLPETPQPAIILAIEGFDQFRQESSEESRKMLCNLMRRKGINFHVIVTGASQDFGPYGHTDNINSVFKDLQSGFFLGYNDYDNLQYLPIKLSHTDTQKYLPSGNAFFVQRGGRYRIVQIASSHHGKPCLDEWIREIINKKDTNK